MSNNEKKDVTPDNAVLDDLLKDPFSTPNAPVVNDQQVTQTGQPEQMIDRLNPEQRADAEKLAQQIDVSDTQSVMTYGAQAQTKLSEFSQGMLSKVQSQDTGAIGDALSGLMFRLNEASPEDLQAGDSNFFKRMFGKVRKSIYEIQAKYQKIGAQIDTIAVKLDKEKNNLLNDNRLL